MGKVVGLVFAGARRPAAPSVDLLTRLRLDGEEVLGPIEIEGCALHRHTHDPVRISPQHNARTDVSAQLSEITEARPRKYRGNSRCPAVEGGCDVLRLLAPRSRQSPQV